MMRFPTTRWFRYSTSLVATGVAALASLLLYPALAGTPSVLFTAAVMVSAWAGGFGPGIVATAVGAIVFDYMSIDSPYSFTLESPASALYLSGFVAVELLMTSLTALLRDDIARREMAESELRRLTGELQTRARTAEAGYQELSLLHDISQSVLGTAELNVLAEQFLDGAMRVGAYDLGLLRLERNDGTFEVVANRGFSDAANVPPAQHPSTFSVVHAQTPRVVEDVSGDPRWARMQREGVQSLVLVPVLAGNDVLGFLLLGKRSPHTFGQSDIKLVEAVASQAGFALQKARLYAETATSLALIEGTLESTADGILVVDGELRILRYNQRFADMWRVPESALASRSAIQVMESVLDQVVDPNDFAQRAQALYANAEVDGFDVIKFKDGRVFERVSHAHHIRGGQAIRVCSFRDVTERREIERRLLRAQRLETAGVIAGQVAHDFNNLLAPLMGYPELIKIQLPEDHRAVGYCDIMLQAVEQMAQINEDLLAFGRRGHFERAPTDVNEAVKDVLRQLDPLPPSLATTVDLSPVLLPVASAPAQLSRLISNLVNNAREAIQDSGTLTIRTDNVYLDQPVGRLGQIPTGEYVRLDVSDTGPGIDATIRDRIFDPFFTTKTGGKRRGAGLGLSVVQAVVEDHQGYIDLATAPGAGATFSVYLPITRDAPHTVVTLSPAGGDERILVVDDDPFQRSIAEDLLHSLGYAVSVASSGDEVLAAITRGSFDLVILDMVMPPGMDGAEAYRQILERRPGQRAILVSGFAESDRVRLAQDLGAGAFLQKPVTRQRLAAAVREELDRTGSRAHHSGSASKS